MATSIMVDALTQLLFAKGVFAKEELYKKLNVDDLVNGIHEAIGSIPSSSTRSQ